MDLSASQCSSSGCESGWTLYLDQSSLSKTQYQGFGGFEDYVRVEGEKEQDLSMVSDASSGPPHFVADGEDCFDQVPQKSKNIKKVKEQYSRSQHLDDTATSPAFGKKVTTNEASLNQVLGMSQDFSEKQIKGKSMLKKHFGFFQPSLAEIQVQKNQVDSREENGNDQWL